MSFTLTVKALEQRFMSAGVDNAKRVAEELIASVLDCRPMEVYLCDGPLSPDQVHSVEAAAKRIENGEPLQYVVGHVDFRGLKIKCDPRALIPRPETELLVEEILNSGSLDTESAAIVDVGTGTGCIVLALAQEHPEARFLAVDSSPGALELARENARFHELERKIQWKQNHLLDGVAPGSHDAVIANLPYIATNDWERLSPAVRDHEPQSALDSGPSGMELIEELVAQARTVLVPGGRLFLEFGYDQGDAVARCLNRAGYRNIRIRQDLAGLDRMAIAMNP